MSRPETKLMNYERELVLLETIKENPDAHHNALLKLIVPKFMAKTTFEKTRDSLIEKELVSVTLKNNMKFYHMTENYERKLSQRIEQTTNSSFHHVKSMIRRLETDFPHKDIGEKIIFANSLLKELMQTDNGFTLLDSVKNPKKTLYRDEHLTIQQLIFKVFEIVRRDKDHELLLPTVISFLGVFLKDLPGKQNLD